MFEGVEIILLIYVYLIFLGGGGEVLPEEGEGRFLPERRGGEGLVDSHCTYKGMSLDDILYI